MRDTGLHGFGVNRGVKASKSPCLTFVEITVSGFLSPEGQPVQGTGIIGDDLRIPVYGLRQTVAESGSGAGVATAARTGP